MKVFVSVVWLFEFSKNPMVSVFNKYFRMRDMLVSALQNRPIITGVFSTVDMVHKVVDWHQLVLVGYHIFKVNYKIPTRYIL
jgi:hypothetical protein